MGTTKEDRYQETLARVAQLRNAGQEVLCKLQPEPENPIDYLAIAFRCEVDSSWHAIGYVVKEALNDVHEALSAKRITALSFDYFFTLHHDNNYVDVKSKYLLMSEIFFQPCL